jgi:hypothetical protein
VSLELNGDELRRAGDVLRELVVPPPTLGRYLAEQGQRTANRYLPSRPWLNALAPVIQRAVDRPVPAGARFRRTEAVPLPAGMPATETVGEPADAWTDLEPSTIGRTGSDWEDEGRPLQPGIRDRLLDTIGTAAGAVRVREGSAAEAIARAYRADAVTFGRDVYFAQGRFRPHDDRGFALLAHEATHVLQAMRPDAAWRRATQPGFERDEQEARARERDVLADLRSARVTGALSPAAAGVRAVDHPGRPGARGSSGVGPQPGPALSPAGPASRPMAAETDRDLSAPAPMPAAPNFEELRRALYRDLIGQIRTDFERGG